MPVLTANQIAPGPSQSAGLSARASFTAAGVLPPPTQVAWLEPEYLPDLDLSAEQVVEAPAQRARLVLATWRGPAEPRPPGVPAMPRPL